MRARAICGCGFAAAVLAACASAPLRDDAVPTDAPAEAPTAAEPAREAAFMALSLVGTPYAAQGGSPSEGFDCSGLVAYVYARALRLQLPRNTFALARAGVAVPPRALQPGDLVFYNTQHKPYSHVGIYLGESRFVH